MKKARTRRISSIFFLSRCNNFNWMFFSIDRTDGKMSTRSIFIGFYINHGYLLNKTSNTKKFLPDHAMSFHLIPRSSHHLLPGPTSSWVIDTKQTSYSLRNYKDCFLNSLVAGGLAWYVIRTHSLMLLSRVVQKAVGTLVKRRFETGRYEAD